MAGMKPGRGGGSTLGTLAIGLAALAMLRGTGLAQEAAAPPAGQEADPLYRFIERYAAPKDERKAKGAIGQYRVALKQTIRTVTDNPRGAPNREERVRQAIYSERPAEISSIDSTQVISLVRHYESFRTTPDLRSKPSDPWPMDGLTIWYSAQPGDFPKILNLTPGRKLRDQEYTFAAEQVFLPDLAAALPSPLPARRGDTYRVAKEGVVALIGTAVDEGGFEGKLLEVRDDPKAGKRVAVFDVHGRVVTEAGGDVNLNARIEFAFDPPPRGGESREPAAAKSEAKVQEQPVEVFGGVTKVLMRNVETAGLAGPNNRGRRRIDRQLILERQLVTEGPALVIPDPVPAETPENSWLTSIDPQKRFHFRHPQGLRIQRSPPGQVILGDSPSEREGRQVVLFYEEKSQKQPDDVFRKIFEGVRTARRAGLAPGAYQTLNWPGVRVLRKDAALKAGAAGGTTTQLDAYVIQFARDATLIAEATCPKERAVPFRKDVEEMLKSFQVGPPRGN